MRSYYLVGPLSLKWQRFKAHKLHLPHDCMWWSREVIDLNKDPECIICGERLWKEDEYEHHSEKAQAD
jgi:hypothetical protein